VHRRVSRLCLVPARRRPRTPSSTHTDVAACSTALYVWLVCTRRRCRRSIRSARERVKERAQASGALRGLDMLGLGVVARTLLTGRPEDDAGAEAAAGGQEERKGEECASGAEYGVAADARCGDDAADGAAAGVAVVTASTAAVPMPSDDDGVGRGGDVFGRESTG
jgi:hypothetical protein